MAGVSGWLGRPRSAGDCRLTSGGRVLARRRRLTSGHVANHRREARGTEHAADGVIFLPGKDAIAGWPFVVETL